MTTLNDIITNAMRRIGVCPVGETPSAEEAAANLSVLNDMMLALPTKGVHTGWTALTLTNAFPLEDRHIEGVTWMLAEAIAPDYGHSLSAEQKKKAVNGWLALEADYKILERLRVDPLLVAMPSQRFWGGWS